MKRILSLGVLALGVTAVASSCVIDHDASSVELQWVSAPSQSCQYAVGNPILSSGSFDPSLADEYELAFQARNNMILASTDSLTFGPLGNARDQGTGVNIIGFEGCWYQYAGAITEFGDLSGGSEAVDCTSIPAQAGSIPTAAQLDAGLGQGIVGLTVLTPGMMKSIFGSDFDLDTLLADSNNYVGVVNTSRTEAEIVNELRPPGEVGDANRAAAWGTKWPATLSTTVVLQLRAVFTKQGGGTGYTNWTLFPIEICPTCLSGQCGFAQLTRCGDYECSDPAHPGDANFATACPTTGAPTPGFCVSGKQCQDVTAVSGGKFVDYTTGSACLPAQSVSTTITCTAYTTASCPTGPL